MNEAFAVLWNDLNAYYGKNQTNPMVINEYEQEAKGIPASKKNDFFRHIVHTYDFFPKLSEFSAACSKFKVLPKAKEHNDRCVYCLGGGLLRYNRKVEGLSYNPEYFAACVCEKGRGFKSKRIFGIEEVWQDKTQEVLMKLAEQNGGTRNVAELQEQFNRRLDIMAMRHQSMKRA